MKTILFFFKQKCIYVLPQEEKHYLYQESSHNVDRHICGQCDFEARTVFTLMNPQSLMNFKVQTIL